MKKLMGILAIVLMPDLVAIIFTVALVVVVVGCATTPEGTTAAGRARGLTDYGSPEDVQRRAEAREREDKETAEMVERMRAVRVSFNQNEFLGCQSISRVDLDDIGMYRAVYSYKADDALPREFRWKAVQVGANAVYVLPDQKVSRTETVDRTLAEKIGRALFGPMFGGGDPPRISTTVETIRTAELYRCPDPATAK